MSGIRYRVPNWQYEEPLTREQFIGTLLPEVQQELIKAASPNPRMRLPLLNHSKSIEVDDVR